MPWPWDLPPSPGGWNVPWWMRWIPIGWRYGWLHRSWRCYEPRCWRTWHYDGQCTKHIQEFYKVRRNPLMARDEQPQEPEDVTDVQDDATDRDGTNPPAYWGGRKAEGDQIKRDSAAGGNPDGVWDPPGRGHRG